MGHRYVTASASILTQPVKVTSVVCSPVVAASDSAYVTLYNATAATANTEVLFLRSGSAGKTVVWNDSSGILVSNLYVGVNTAYCTVVWD